MRIDGWGFGRFWKILECERESLGGGLVADDEFWWESWRSLGPLKI